MKQQDSVVAILIEFAVGLVLHLHRPNFLSAVQRKRVVFVGQHGVFRTHPSHGPRGVRRILFHTALADECV